MATIYGTTGDDVLIGTPENDFIFGDLGADSITGLDGNDSLVGGEGNDTVKGDVGDDTLYAGLSVYQGPGVFGEDYNSTNFVYGGDSNDWLVGSSGKDYLFGDDGNDTVTASVGEDYLDGGEGNDKLDGGFDNDTIVGGNGDDTLAEGPYSSASGNDVLDGGDGNDLLDGETQNDLLVGGGGDDSLIGAGYGPPVGVVPYGRGTDEIDSLTGAQGRDTFYLGQSYNFASFYSSVFYDDGVLDSAGTNGYALIVDFDPNEDIIQLAGTADNYILGSSSGDLPTGTGVFLDKPGTEPDELIGIIQGFPSSSLSLDGTYFSYVA